MVKPYENNISLTLQNTSKEVLRKVALKDRRSVNNWINRAIETALEKHYKHDQKMEYYYKNNESSYVYEIGTGSIKYKVKRNIRKLLKWYFNDKFSLTLNLIGLVMVML